MFKAIDVWKRISDSEAVRYRCFQCLRTGKYSVQSADFYRLPENPAQSDQLDRQHIELFVQQAPDEKTGAYDTLEAAIDAHEAEFGPRRVRLARHHRTCGAVFFRILLGRLCSREILIDSVGNYHATSECSFRKQSKSRCSRVSDKTSCVSGIHS